MIGLDTGYFFRLSEKTEQSIQLLDTAMQEARDVVVCTITIYERLRRRLRGSLDAALVDLVLNNRAAFRWIGADAYEVPRRAAGHASRHGAAPRLRRCRIVEGGSRLRAAHGRCAYVHCSGV